MRKIERWLKLEASDLAALLAAHPPDAREEVRQRLAEMMKAQQAINIHKVGEAVWAHLWACGWAGAALTHPHATGKKPAHPDAMETHRHTRLAYALATHAH